MVSKICRFHPYLWKWSILTSIFFRWVGSTTNQKCFFQTWHWGANVGPLNPHDANRHVELEREGAAWTCVRAPREFWSRWLGKPDGTWEWIQKNSMCCFLSQKKWPAFFLLGGWGSWCDFCLKFKGRWKMRVLKIQVMEVGICIDQWCNWWIVSKLEVVGA